MRILAWLLLPFCGAIVLSNCLKLWWICLLFAVASLGAALVFARQKGVRRTAGLLAAVGAFAGFLWFGGYTLAEVRPLQAISGKESAFSAVVTAYPTPEEGRTQVSVRLESGMGAGHRARLLLDDWFPELKPGDRVIGQGSYTAAGTPEGYAADRWAAQGEFLVIRGVADSVLRGTDLPWTAFAPAVGRALTQRIQQLYPGESGALLTGLISGDKSGLSDVQYTAFQRAGIAHLLAVSGLHVGFLTGILYVIPGDKRRRVLVAIPLLVFFALMTGEQASVWRAVIMASMLLSAPLFGRENDPITSLSVALALLLIQNPYACGGIGLQLSFAAVAGLACVQAPLYRWMGKPLAKPWAQRHRWLHPLWHLLAGALSTACAATVLTLPLCAWYFRRISLVGPFSNLLTIWCASLAFVLGLLSCLLSFVSMPLAGGLVWVVKRLLACLIALTKWLSRGSYAALTLDSPYLIGWFTVTLCLVVAVMRSKHLRRHPWLPIGASVSLLCLALSLQMLTLSTSPFTVTALGVRNGGCTVLGSRGNYVAVDCRGSGAGDRLADYLASGGTKRLSLLVLDHLDRGRLENVEQLLERVEVDCVALPPWETGSHTEMEWSELLQDNQCEVILLNGTYEGTVGEVHCSIVPVFCGEEVSAPVLCRWQDHAVLVRGNLDQAGEQAVLERWNQPKLDALILEEGTAGASLLRQTHPDCAVLSAGSAVPSREELLRLHRYGAVIYTTDRNGSVTIRY